jgi:hypothetical protein
MSDPTDGYARHVPTKFTFGNVLIYLAPISCFAYLGPFWKVGSFLAISLGLWRSPGFLRKAFGIAFLLTLLVWGVHARVDEQDWPASPLFMVWWLGSFATRWHADGERAEAEAQRPVREWE